MTIKITVACFALLLMIASVKATPLPQNYAGQSGCAADLKSSFNNYAIRLEARPRARLEAHEFKTQTILTIVQYSGAKDRCGVVRDAIQAKSPNDAFVFWECTDKRDPSAVVVGTRPMANANGPALEAWRIDLKTLTFARLHVPVTCRSRSGAGFDDGGDLATWAKQRAARLAAPPSHACDLAQSLQREIAKKYPGARVVTQSDLARDDLEFYRHDHGNACPGLAKADFFGDGKPALAVVLITRTKKDSQLIIAREAGTGWTIQPLDTGGGGPIPVVWSQPPAKYTDVDNGKILRAVHPAFVFCGYEGWAIVYAWTGKKVDKVWIMD